MFMLHNLEAEDLPATSQERFDFRLVHFELDKSKFPRLRYYFYWLLHNCFSHLLLGIFPNNKTFEIHELTSQWLNHIDASYVPHYIPKGLRYRYEHMLVFTKPIINDKFWWMFHNSVVHMLIGLFPITIMFRLHDWSATKIK